jgi:hypothetical protein
VAQDIEAADTKHLVIAPRPRSRRVGLLIITIVGPTAALLGAAMLGMGWIEALSVLGVISGGLGLRLAAPDLF